MAAQYDAKATDPPLLERNSQIKSYATSRATYPGLRIYYRRHPHADTLPKDPAPIPLLVFIHGLGGSAAQFKGLLQSLTSVASCLAIDLPGCGVSDFAPQKWDAYTTDALVELLEIIIEDYREQDKGQGVVLIGHSMGASLAALLANPRAHSPAAFHEHVVGLVAICPSGGPPPPDKVKLFRRLLYVPEFLFNLWRLWDRRGGQESPSVHRFVGADADPEAKRLQHLFNYQSRTPVWRRMAWGCLPDYRNGLPEGGLPTTDVWAGVRVPLYLVAGEDDHITPPEEIMKIVEARRATGTEEHRASFDSPPSDTGSFVAVPSTKVISEIESMDFERQKKAPPSDAGSEDPVTPNDASLATPPAPRKTNPIVEVNIFPAPANHAILFAPPWAPVLAGLVSDFLATKVTGRLSLAWQLQYLCRDGKWDVKNLEKWCSVAPVSAPIGDVFLAIKTLREVDEVHCPREFVRNWGGRISDVIDISHDNPVYDPKGLEKGGIRYHKYATVSKVPPTDNEIKGFIEVVDKIRAKQRIDAGQMVNGETKFVGVHCHYGFNRTGFLIVCYLVERCGFKVSDAIDHFARARPHGIKHAHFKDRLHVRYSEVRGK